MTEDEGCAHKKKPEAIAIVSKGEANNSAICPMLNEAHDLTGCDTTSRLQYRREKQKALTPLQKRTSLR